jgi:hypothetical protein
MINNPNQQSSDKNSPETNIRFNEANMDSSSERSDKGEMVNKLKNHGKKSLAPVIEVLHKYQNEINPYFDAITKGLKAGADALQDSTTAPSSESAVNQDTRSSANQFIGSWFAEAANWFSEVKQKLALENIDEVTAFLNEQGRRNPGMIFSSSYLAGLAFGRIGRHIGRQKNQQSSSSLNTDSTLQ